MQTQNSNDTAQRCLRKLRELLPAIEQAFPAVSMLYVFGSAAGARFTEHSDVDIAVYVDDDMHKRDRLLDLRLSLWLQDRLDRPVDVVVLNEASSILQHEVLRAGCRLLDRSPAFRVKRELRMFKDYLDVRHYQRKRTGVPGHGK